MPVKRAARIEPGDDSVQAGLSLPFFYNYRSVRGGTKGVVAWYNNGAPATPKAPQTYVSGGIYRIDAYAKVDDRYMLATNKHADLAWNEVEFNETSGGTSTNKFTDELGDGPWRIRYPLDNISDDWQKSRFALNRRVSRHPIDVLLMFLTTMPGEELLADAAVGCTTTVVNLPTVTPGTYADHIGKALHCVEGTNKGVARVITAGSATSITVDRPFPGAASSGDQHQIRNTIYDVLPIGWGMAVAVGDIDIPSFEMVRDRHLGGARLGKFVLGEDPEIDVWQLLLENVAKPYGILIRNDRTTGKMQAVYTGETASGNIDAGDAVVIESKNILDVGSINYTPRPPLGEIQMSVRKTETSAVKTGTWVWSDAEGFKRQVPSYIENSFSSLSAASGDEASRTFRNAREEIQQYGSNIDVMNVSAMCNSMQTSDWLAAHMLSRLLREERPSPELEITLDMSFIQTVQSGDLLKITDTDRWEPFNPATGSRGWNGLVFRVLSSTIQWYGSIGLRCRIGFVDTAIDAVLAPAANVTAKGSDGGGSYFTVNLQDFSVSLDDDDWDRFGQGDLIELRDRYGALVASYTVKHFGSNTSSTPQGASDARLYVTTTITPTIAGTEYVTYQPWSASNTANMNDHSSYADANKTLGAGNDDARIYR